MQTRETFGEILIGNHRFLRPGIPCDDPIPLHILKPGLHIVAMVVITIPNMFPDSVPSNSDTREHFDYNIASLTGIVINCSVPSSCNDCSNP